MVDNQHPIPKGVVVTRGNPVCKYERALSESAKPGMLVVFDTNDYTVQKADGTGLPYGWLGYELSPADCRPDTIETAYNVGDIASVVAGANFEIYALVTGASGGSTIVPGTRMTDAGDGTLAVATAGDEVIAIAQESATVGEGAVSRIHVISLI